MKKISLPLAAFVFVMCATWGGMASAHHSFAMFDRTKTTTITGTVRTFEWTNPHIYLWLFVPNAKGGQDIWGIEGNSVNILSRVGWTKKTFVPGDKITLTINPLKSGGTGGAFISATTADGRKITQRGV